MSSITPIGKILKEIDQSGLCNFEPSKSQKVAKTRFWRTIRANPLLATSIEDFTLDALVMHSGAKRLTDWIDKEPLFLAWFCDENFEEITIQSMAMDALKEVYDIMTSPMEEKMLTAKDKLNAANLLLQLADKFPNKRTEVRWADRDVGRMGEEDVRREKERVDKLLGTGKTLDTDG